MYKKIFSNTNLLNVNKSRFLKQNTRFVSHNQFEDSFLHKRVANYTPLTPLSFLKRTVSLYPNETAYINHTYDDKEEIVTWKEMSSRVNRLAHALTQPPFNINRGDVVSILAPNSPSTFESHYAVPGTRGVLHSINTRLDATTIAYQLRHCRSKVFIVDTEFVELADQVRQNMIEHKDTLPIFVSINTLPFDEKYKRMFIADYENIISSGDKNFKLLYPHDEFDAITLNYTSGTTGNPKGVVYSHRGSYLQAISNVVELELNRFKKMLWLVPMFHCNGWCFPWSSVAAVTPSVLIRQIKPELMFDIINRFKINFMGGAPTIMSMLLNSPAKMKFDHPITMWAAGSPPPPSVIKQMENELGIHIQTAYGLTEVYGPSTTFNQDPNWKISEEEKDGFITTEDLYNRKIWQSRNVLIEDVQVLDPKTYQQVPADGTTLGEVMFRGNVVMKGYLNNPKATEEAFENGWFHSGDLAVYHGNGRFEMKDRSKDIIISGGENISTIEIENILNTHPAIYDAAVIGMPHELWGEVPLAFVSFKPDVTEEEKSTYTEAYMIEWCKTKMAKFQAPKKFIFGPLPKTSTGKIQKHELRKVLKNLK